MSHKATEDLKIALISGDALIGAAVGAVQTAITNMNNEIANDGGSTGITISMLTPALGGMASPSGDIDSSIGQFTDYMINHGKDMIMVSDQADQFVCIANDTFSRIVDVYGTLQSDFVTPYVTAISTIVEKLSDIQSYVESRQGYTSTSEVAETQNQVDILNQVSIDNYNSFLATLNDAQALYEMSTTTLNQFKEILQVNAVVGIALSLSKQGYQELVVMNQLYYRIDTDNPDDVVVTDSGDSTIFNSNDTSFKEDQKRLLKLLTASLLEKHDYIDNTGTVRVDHTLDGSPADIIVPKALQEFQLVPSDIVADKPSFNLFDDLFKAITFAEHLNNESKLTDTILQLHYDTIIDPLVSFEVFKAEFVTINEVLLKFIGGIDAPIISESKDDFKLHQNWKILKDLISLRDSQAIPSEPKTFKGIELFNGTSTENSEYYNDYMSQLYNTYSVSTEFFDTSEQYIAAFNYVYQEEDLTVTSKSGNCVVSVFEGFGADEKLIELVAKFPFKTKYYSDSIGVVYVEAQIGDNVIILKDNVLYTFYKTLDVDHHSFTSVNTSHKDITLGYKMSGYLSNEDSSLSLTKQYLKIDDNNVLNKSALGIIEKSKISTKIISDDASATTFTLNKRTVSEIDNIIYTNDYNQIERIVTNITNVYREKLINKEIDFTEARLKSILGSLEYLDYQRKFDNYIDYTWTAGVPRVVREH